jgi:hypothetical protein
LTVDIEFIRRGLETRERRALAIYPAINYANTMLFNSIIKKHNGNPIDTCISIVVPERGVA